MWQVPEGEDANDERWRNGYADGWKEDKPKSEDPVYISGWCHGYAETSGLPLTLTGKAYLDALYSGGL